MTNHEPHEILRNDPAQWRERLSRLHAMLADAASVAERLRLPRARDNIRSAIKSAANESMEIAEATFKPREGDDA